jgi:16S rRNA (guanine527-N7)-methyltransferase
VSDPPRQLLEGAERILLRRLTDHEAGLFCKYLDLLAKWNRTHRLLGSDSPAWILDNIVLDSLLFLMVLPSPLHRLADLGSGAGVPGIPLKIVCPEIDMTLIEARGKRASFLSEAVRVLSLPTIRVLHGRAEDHLAELASGFDAVVMRCAGPIGQMADLARRLLRPGGVVVAAASPRDDDEGIVTVPGVRPGSARRFVVLR